MKKLFFPIAALLLLVVGCKSGDTNEVDVESYALCDSVYIAENTGDKIKYTDNKIPNAE